MKFRILIISLIVVTLYSCKDNSEILVSNNVPQIEIALSAGGTYSNILIKKNIENGKVDTLVIGLTINSYPIWSPNGENILFISNNAIISYSFVTKKYSKLTNDGGEIWGQPSWSPDNNKFTYAVEINYKSYLAITSLDGLNKTLFKTDINYDYNQPQWSPNSKLIVFETFAFPRDLLLFNVSDSSITQILETKGDKIDPRWSPDGTKIAYSYFYAPNQGIYIVNVDGSGNKYISKESAYSRYPVWSPDGKKIAYLRMNSTRNYKYCYYDLATDEEVIVDDQLDDIFIGSWSHNSMLLSYEKKINNKLTYMIYNIQTKVREEIIIGGLSFFSGSFRP